MANVEIFIHIKYKYYKVKDFIEECFISFLSGYRDGVAGKPRADNYVRYLQSQIKEFGQLKMQGIVNSWEEYKILKEKQNTGE